MEESKKVPWNEIVDEVIENNKDFLREVGGEKRPIEDEKLVPMPVFVGWVRCPKCETYFNPKKFLLCPTCELNVMET